MARLFKGGENYSVSLPIKLRKRIRCAAMDKNGNLCDEPAIFKTPYHGADIETDRMGHITWVVVDLCEFHGDAAKAAWEAKISPKHRRKLAAKGKLEHLGGPP